MSKKVVEGCYVVTKNLRGNTMVSISIREMEQLLKDAKKTRETFKKDVFLKHLSPDVTFVFYPEKHKAVKDEA